MELRMLWAITLLVSTTAAFAEPHSPEPEKSQNSASQRAVQVRTQEPEIRGFSWSLELPFTTRENLNTIIKEVRDTGCNITFGISEGGAGLLEATSQDFRSWAGVRVYLWSEKGDTGPCTDKLIALQKNGLILSVSWGHVERLSESRLRATAREGIDHLKQQIDEIKNKILESYVYLGTVNGNAKHSPLDREGFKEKQNQARKRIVDVMDIYSTSLAQLRNSLSVLEDSQELQKK